MLYAQDSLDSVANFQAIGRRRKDGAIEHVMSGVNPQGCQVIFVQGSDQRRPRPRLPLALHEVPSPNAAASASSIARNYEETLVVARASRIPRQAKAAPEPSRSTSGITLGV